jgi:hypothetical protein
MTPAPRSRRVVHASNHGATRSRELGESGLTNDAIIAQSPPH